MVLLSGKMVKKGQIFVKGKTSYRRLKKAITCRDQIEADIHTLEIKHGMMVCITTYSHDFIQLKI